MIHTALLSTRTIAILDSVISYPYPGMPICFYTVNDTMYETFGIYRGFLYTGKLFSHDAEGDQDFADDGDGDAHEDREWARLELAYLLGLKMGDEKFCNTVIDALIEKVVETVYTIASLCSRACCLLTRVLRTVTQPISPLKSTPTPPAATSCVL
jgi:hypothetical protein